MTADANFAVQTVATNTYLVVPPPVSFSKKLTDLNGKPMNVGSKVGEAQKFHWQTQPVGNGRSTA